METKRINLTGNRSLINNKAHIDENWEKFSKNNSPYLRDALVPHYLKEESKETASHIVFDKEGNKYYLSNDKFFVNDEAIAEVNSAGFSKIDLEEDYLCYDVNGPAYILDNICYFGEYTYQIEPEILFARVRVINGNAYFLISYYNEDNILYQQIIVILADGTIETSSSQIAWGQLVNGTTWTSVADQTIVSSFRCNIGYLKGQEGDECIGFTLIGNASSNNKESELYFYNSIYDIDENEFFNGSQISWIGLSGEQTFENSWQVPYTVVHTREVKNIATKYYVRQEVPGATVGYFFPTPKMAADYSAYQAYGTYYYGDSPKGYNQLPINFQTYSKETGATYWNTFPSVVQVPNKTDKTITVRERTAYSWQVIDKFTISIPESANNHTGVPQAFTLTYTDANGDPQTLTDTMGATQKEITLQHVASSPVMNATVEEIFLEAFNITSLEVTQTIGGTDYTESIPVENIAFTSLNTTEEYIGFIGDTSNVGVIYSIDLADYMNGGQNTYIAWDWITTVTIEAPTTLCNVFEDSGYLRSVPVYDYKHASLEEFIILGQVFSLAKNGTSIDLSFNVLRSFNNTETYTYFASSCYNFNQAYFEVLFCVFDSSYSDAKTHNIYNNSGLQQEIIGDIGMTNDGSKKWFTEFGAIAPLDDTKWRLLYNYGTIVNISYGEANEEGSILTDWNTIDESFYISYKDNAIVYKDITGIHKIYLDTVEKNVQILENNYILINTISYLNCYDIKAKKLIHFATDYNNRCYTGWRASLYGYFVDTGSWKDAWEDNPWEVETPIFCASGQNVNYAITGNPIVSSIFPPQNLYHVVKGKEYYCFGDNSYVDIYYGLKYINSIKKNQIKYIDSRLYPDAQYPLSSNNVNYFNIPLLLTLISTHNNKDMIKAGTMFYPVQYYNDNIPIFIYSTLGGLDGATNMFVIQSQFYAVMGGKICAVSYAENVVSNVEAIIDISGMQFIGYLPTFALFYSPKNKNIYSFTGDANLEKIDDASEIGNLKHALYNSFTKTIHVITDKGVCIIGDTIYMIEFPGIEEIFFTKDFSVLETTDKLYKLSFEKLSDEYSVLPLIFETEFFGGLNDSVITIYKWSMRFIKDSVSNGKIKLSTVTLTDKGSETREKVYNVSNADWDKLTDSFYIQFCPENNKATGHKIRIESDFPLTSLIAQITTDGSLTSAKNTMKI